MSELSIFEAAREAPTRVAIETTSRSLTFEACAAEAARMQSGADPDAYVRFPRFADPDATPHTGWGRRRMQA